MRIKESLKLNRFKFVRIPKKSELFRQYGELTGKADFAGDEVFVPNSGRKADAFRDSEDIMRKYDELRDQEENK